MGKEMVSYQAKDFTALLGNIGLSDALLNNHFKLYQGYVKNTNAVCEKLQVLSAAGSDRTPEYGELKRRLGWEFNGMRLHEYYFGNLGGEPSIDLKGKLYQKISVDFASFESWKKDFISCGLMRGIGWVILYLDLYSNRLMNIWINEHDAGHLAGAAPILVMDVFEHAYITDFGLERQKYIETLFDHFKWGEAEKRILSLKK